MQPDLYVMLFYFIFLMPFQIVQMNYIHLIWFKIFICEVRFHVNNVNAVVRMVFSFSGVKLQLNQISRS